MSRDNQIEEMALALSEGGCGKKCDCIEGDKFNCHLLYSASVLYNAGYRLASDVAREIFAEIEEIVDKNTQMTNLETRPELEIELKNGTSYIVSPTMKITGYNTRQIFRLILELKKKYTEGEG